MSVCVAIKGLTKRFGALVAVDNIFFDIDRGEMLGIVGPDGAGKTTTIRMLCGVVKPDAGTATVLGYDLLSNIDAIRLHIGYLSQKFSLYGDLTVDENIEYFARIHFVNDLIPRREELLEFTRLTPFRNRLADKL
jgi:ABC-2 type transport system ATP-binding protein